MNNLVLLQKIVAHVESLNNPHAIRFEERLYQSFKKRRINDAKVRCINKCSRNTAMMILATSWGKYQILGINLYNMLNYDRSVGSYLMFEIDQDITFNNFLMKNFKTISLLNLCNDVIKELKYINVNLKKSDINELTDFLIKNEENIPLLKNFIRVYNGAIFPSSSFQNYLLRMLHAYRKFSKEV